MVPSWRAGSRSSGDAAEPAVHLWHASLRYPAWSKLRHLLSDGELRRADRFTFERDARRYVVSHAVLRTVLGRMIGVRPNDVALRTEAGGRPVMRDGGTGIHFSLSRSDERVLIGVSASPLGVDLEWLGAPIDVDALAETIFSPRERLVFGQTPPERRREIFLRCWTWKEAILKATGQGLSIPPAEAEVLLTPGSVTRTEAIIVSLGARWKVLTVPPRTGFVGAVAAALEPLPFAFAHGSGPVSCRLAGAPLD